MEKEVGVVSHYFGRINVGAIELTDTLEVGDMIHIMGHTTDFTQKVESMEIEHVQVDKAKKGDSIGIKVDEKVRDGDIVYKVIEPAE
jgi:translation elongation factor EF-1alpha